jgi:arsenate reductase (thioredoxin)
VLHSASECSQGRRLLRSGHHGQCALRMKRILFVCVENSNRSQMAEGFTRKHGGHDVIAMSAGSRPSGTINPRAIQFMSERQIDLSAQQTKSLDDVGNDAFDVVVTMGCGDACPWIAATRRLDWALPDPKQLADAEFRRVRDEIEQRVLELLGELHGEHVANA